MASGTGIPVPEKESLDVVPAEYTDSQKTPLVVDTAESPFHLKIQKPGSLPEIEK